MFQKILFWEVCALNGFHLMNWLECKFRNKYLAYGAIAAFSLLAYCNSFTVPFLLDDFGSISNNYAIQKLFDFPALWQFYANPDRTLFHIVDQLFHTR